MKARTILCTATLLLGVAVPAAAALSAGFFETVVVSGLVTPTGFVFAPDGRIFITQKDGAIRVVSDGALLPAPAITLAVTGNSERGLLGIALDPSFASNGFVYVYYTTSAGSVQPPGHPFDTPKNRVSRFTVSGNTVLADSEMVLVDDILSDAGHHNAGGLLFGPDGKLYVSTGDGGELPAQSQNLATLAGKILRINANGTIPSDNPYFTGPPGARKEIWCLGLRNPWRFTFDPAGRLFIGDVGSNLFEEINLGAPGANYGWPMREGIVGDGNPSFVDPIYAYPHGGGASITLGAFDTAGVYPADVMGGLFFSDFVQNFMRILHYDSGTVTVTDLGTVAGGLVHFAPGPDGRMQYLAIVSGELRRLDFDGRRLTVVVIGSGTIASSPPGIACGVDCHQDYVPGTVVALTATPAPGFDLAGWSGDQDCLDGVVTLSVARTCTAWFAMPVAGAQRTGGDLDGDGRADLAVYRPASGLWSWLSSRTGFLAGFEIRRGGPADIPVPGDYDGDGRAELAYFSSAGGTWRIDGIGTVQFGRPGDIPVPADYNGDGRTDIALYRPSVGAWFVRGQFERQFGTALDTPVPGRYTGGAAADLALFRRSSGQWFIGDRPPLQFGRSGDLPVPADYNGDGLVEVAVYRRSAGTWFIDGRTPLSWGGVADLPVPLDVDGDGRAELVAFSRATGVWSVFSPTSGGTMSVPHGMTGDWPVALRRANRVPGGDFDGDRRADVAVFRPSTGVWYPAFSTTGFATYSSARFGLSDDIPVPGDYDGDGLSDIAVFRPSTGFWYLGRSISGFADYTAFKWGLPGDIPVPGDYDADGRTDIAVFRPASGVWYMGLSSQNFGIYLTSQFGVSGDVPLPGDYDGDGKTDVAVFRPSTGVWYLGFSSAAFTTYQAVTWGTATDVPAPGDFDGDGRTDVAFFRPSTGVWLAGYSSTGFSSSLSMMWGIAEDVPVPSDYDGDGRADLAVFRPSTGVWYPGFSSTGFTFYLSPKWGIAEDIPVLKRP